ncbi:hypothetical protein DFJ73DRAFT_760861 [Zopfochytrium polystomum]|nr:hypothetical protein DFJ73DRAFT_760861 [Zopfochytrium polystomum]
MSRKNSPQWPYSKRRREESFHQIDNYADDTRDYRDRATGHNITNHHNLTFSRNGEDKDWLVEGHDELKDIILDGVCALHRKFTITVYLPKPVVDEVRMFDAKGGLGKVFVFRRFEEDE